MEKDRYYYRNPEIRNSGDNKLICSILNLIRILAKTELPVTPIKCKVLYVWVFKGLGASVQKIKGFREFLRLCASGTIDASTRECAVEAFFYCFYSPLSLQPYI